MHVHSCHLRKLSISCSFLIGQRCNFLASCLLYFFRWLHSRGSQSCASQAISTDASKEDHSRHQTQHRGPLCFKPSHQPRTVFSGRPQQPLYGFPAASPSSFPSPTNTHTTVSPTPTHTHTPSPPSALLPPPTASAHTHAVWPSKSNQWVSSTTSSCPTSHHDPTGLIQSWSGSAASRRITESAHTTFWNTSRVPRRPWSPPSCQHPTTETVSFYLKNVIKLSYHVDGNHIFWQRMQDAEICECFLETVILFISPVIHLFMHLWPASTFTFLASYTLYSGLVQIFQQVQL